MLIAMPSPTPEFMVQRPMLSRRGEKKKKKKKRRPIIGGSGADVDGEETMRDDGASPRDDNESLQDELRDVLEQLEHMKRTADVALRALDSHLMDGKWCACFHRSSPSSAF